jgi:hypothetical protein
MELNCGGIAQIQTVKGFALPLPREAFGNLARYRNVSFATSPASNSL